jgi:hypothetical protein
MRWAKTSGTAGSAASRLRPNLLNAPGSSVVFSVVIPVHNETDQIAQNLSLIHAEALKTALPMDMIVIDDGPTCHLAALEKLAEKMPELKAAIAYAGDTYRDRIYSFGSANLTILCARNHSTKSIPLK